MKTGKKSVDFPEKVRALPSYATERDADYRAAREEYLSSFVKSISASLIADNFAKYARRQEITRFLARHELFQKISGIQGCIVECGVYSGQGVMSWAQISSILEPVGGVFRHVYGFDTFAGFPSVHSKDVKGSVETGWKAGDLSMSSEDDLRHCIDLFDKNRFLPQFQKVTLIKGDFLKTGADFLRKNPHVLISLLYLDFDLYEPTKKALELFLPRMPKGSILAFDEINHPLWPGETLALLETLNLRNLEIRKFAYEINISYIIL
jgi:hypothetical protein